jgi:hypothetical protein
MLIDDFTYFTYSFLEIDLQLVHSTLLDQFEDNEKYKLSLNPFRFDLYENKPFSGGKHYPKAVFYNPVCCKEKTIMVSNYSDGWDTLNNLICSKTNSSCYSFKLSNKNIPNALNSFTYRESDSYKRIVSVMKDPKWIFYETGNALWFEDPENYKQKMIKNRLNREILISYSIKLGINLNDDSFGISDEQAIFIERLTW